MAELRVQDLWVSVEGKPVLKGVSLTIKPGQVHVLMGPNASGKSTLGFVLAGHPKYKIERGQVLLNGKDLLQLKPEERAKTGLFLAFQNPIEIPGVQLQQFLYTLYRQKKQKPSLVAFKRELTEAQKVLGLNNGFVDRQLNVGMSGGEKKRAEALQMLLLKPQLAVIDEIDSGLDIDSLKVVGAAINALRNPNFSALLITHYNRILSHVLPDVVHVLIDGKIVASGGPELPAQLEEKGYAWAKKPEKPETIEAA